MEAVGSYVVCDIIEIKNGESGGILLGNSVPDTIEYVIKSIGDQVPETSPVKEGKRLVVDTYAGKAIEVEGHRSFVVKYTDIIGVY